MITSTVENPITLSQGSKNGSSLQEQSSGVPVGEAKSIKERWAALGEVTREWFPTAITIGGSLFTISKLVGI